MSVESRLKWLGRGWTECSRLPYAPGIFAIQASWPSAPAGEAQMLPQLPAQPPDVIPLAQQATQPAKPCGERFQFVTEWQLA